MDPVIYKEGDRAAGSRVWIKHTPREKNRVNAIDPKYAAVNGNRGVERRCMAYVSGP